MLPAGEYILLQITRESAHDAAQDLGAAAKFNHLATSRP